jgi:hypothetical protein
MSDQAWLGTAVLKDDPTPRAVVPPEAPFSGMDRILTEWFRVPRLAGALALTGVSSLLRQSLACCRRCSDSCSRLQYLPPDSRALRGSLPPQNRHPPRWAFAESLSLAAGAAFAVSCLGCGSGAVGGSCGAERGIAAAAASGALTAEKRVGDRRGVGDSELRPLNSSLASRSCIGACSEQYSAPLRRSSALSGAPQFRHFESALMATRYSAH